ncbi:MAG: radical SAM protein [Desulfobacteraceae bacterium]|nr:radical SAM protein [Desulfobacteraceae bacterium]
MNNKASLEPLIFDIARASFVDGPGVRTIVFFKGCPLSCPWCHNPESQSYKAETMYFPEDCIDCGNCKEGKKCLTRARRIIGKKYSPEQLVEIILEDKAYFKTSDGGVTFSGGEALSFINYLSLVLPALKKEDIHIAIQTCGYFDFNSFVSKILQYIDVIFFDFKIMDEDTHHNLLGKSNQIILENFVNLLQHKTSVIPRIPLIPHFVANKNNLDAIAEFFLKHKVKHCEFLYYNISSREKLIRLNREPAEDLPEKAAHMAQNRAWIDYFRHKMKKK